MTAILERRYAKLDVAEDFFINYGFVTNAMQALMHPRSASRVPAEGGLPWPAARRKKAQLLLEFVRERGQRSPARSRRSFRARHGEELLGRLVERHDASARCDAFTAACCGVARREGGIRIYTAHEHGPGPADAAARRARMDALVDVAVGIYAPLPGRSLSFLLRRLRFAVPQWHGEVKGAIERAKQRLSRTRLDDVDWYWPAAEDPARARPQDAVRLLTPFDPVVWDRARFELLWGWV